MEECNKFHASTVFRLSSSQLHSLARQRAQSLRARGVALLKREFPLKCQERTDEQLLAHVEAVAAFAVARQVVQPDNILALLRAQMDKGFSSQLPSYLGHRLEQAGLDEDTRVRNFLDACAEARPPQVISLATPIGQ